MTGKITFEGPFTIACLAMVSTDPPASLLQDDAGGTRPLHPIRISDANPRPTSFSIDRRRDARALMEHDS